MALVLKDRVKETTTTTGTGSLTLLGAATGYQSFSAIGNGNTCYYAISSTGGSEWEVGIGTYSSTGPTLSRDTILESSTGGGVISLSAGTKDVYVVYPAEKGVWLDASGNVVQSQFTSMNVTGTATINVATLTSGTVSTTPASATDIANKQYVDTMTEAGIHYHAPVRVESPTPLNATYNNGSSGVGATLTNAGTQAALVIDGVTVSVNDRVLIYTQTNATQNGIYTVTNVGSGSTNWVLTRATDADTFETASPTGLSQGSTVFVQQGTTGAGETYTCNTPGTIIFGTTNITFAQISSAQIYSAGTGLNLSGTTFSIANTGVNAATYGTASQVPQIAINAQGQITSATNVAIAITASNVSGLAASATTDTTNASNITSGTLANARTTATATNGANTIVARDATGNFAAGAITAVSFSGNGANLTDLNGTAITTGTVANARTTASSSNGANTIVARDASGNFAAATITATTFSGSHSGSGANLTNLNATAITTGTIDNARTTASSTNGASTIVARDASGNFTANVGTFTTITGAGGGITGINASNITSGVLDVAEGGTGLTSLTAGRIPFGAGTSAFGNTADLFWDSANARLGIGTNSPTTKLQVSDGTYALSFVPGNDASIQNNGTSSFTLNSAGAGSKILFRVAGADRATIDASGNFGLGVTPAAWLSTTRALQVGTYSSLFQGQGNGTLLANNSFRNASSQDIYLNTAAASYYSQNAGAHTWFNAASGTAGNPITWIQAMTLDASGNLGLGTTSPLGRFAVNGGTLNTTTYTSSEARIADGAIHLMKTVAGGVFEAVRAMNVDTTAGTTVRLLGAATSDPFNNGNGGKVFVDAIRTATNMDFAISLNDVAGAAPVERLRLTGAGNLGIGTSNPQNYTNYTLITTNGTTGSGVQFRASNTAVYEQYSTAGESLLKTLTSTPLWFGTNNTERMRITSAGNVGIGINNPAYKLDIQTGGSGVGIRASSGNAYLLLAPVFGTGASYIDFTASGSNAQDARIIGGSGSTSNLAFLTGGATLTERMRIDSSGNVGIGTSSPGGRLNVAGTSGDLLRVGTASGNGSTNFFPLVVGDGSSAGGGTNQNFVRLGRFSDGTAGIDAFQGGIGNAPLAFGTFGTERMRIDSNGNVGIGFTSPSAKLQVNGTVVGDTFEPVGALGTMNNGIFLPASKNLGFATNNTERFRIGTNGELGIGGANYGTAGQALVSNGSGSAPSWQTVGGNTTATGLWENANTISTNYTITTNYNAMSAGPITVNSGVTVTVPSGSSWVIV